MSTEGCQKKLLIVNIEPGIDDAQSVMMALADPNVKILALCVQYGNTSIENTTTNALKLLTNIKRTDVPLFKGCGHAIAQQPPITESYFGTDGFGDYEGLPRPDYKLIQPEHAVQAMIRLVKEHPGEITLVCLGPLTNLAMAHRLDPEFSKNVKDCFMMGGNYKGKGNVTPSAEFYFYCDVEAANVVLTEFQCPISIFTWELCLKSVQSWGFYDEIRAIASPKAELMNHLDAKLIGDWKKNASYMICDELAMSGALDGKSVAKSVQVSVKVECHGQLTRGQMVVDWRNTTENQKKVRLVTKMNMEQVKNLMRRAYSG